jgi:hypothetical protein
MRRYAVAFDQSHCVQPLDGIKGSLRRAAPALDTVERPDCRARFRLNYNDRPANSDPKGAWK